MCTAVSFYMKSVLYGLAKTALSIMLVHGHITNNDTTLAQERLE